MLHVIVQDSKADHQLLIRSLRFVQALQQNANPITQLCFSHAVQGSQSSISNTITLISQELTCARVDLAHLSLSNVFSCLQEKSPASEDVVSKSFFIRDLLDMRLSMNDHDLSADELDEMLNYLCTQ